MSGGNALNPANSAMFGCGVNGCPFCIVPEYDGSMSERLSGLITSVRCRLLRGRDAWIRFWFEPADPLPLALIRILTGLMLAYSLCVWGVELDAFFGDQLLQPREAIAILHDGNAMFSLLLYVPQDWLTTILVLSVIVSLMLTVGICTRVTSVLAFIITTSWSQRVPVANFGLDQILGLLCLYLAVGSSGACLSWDSYRRKKHSVRAPETSISARLGIRLIQVHLCIIYLWAGFAKLKGETWWTGEAMWRVIANREYQTADLTWMATVPWMPYLLAHITIVWEVFFCVLIWNRTLRPLILFVGVCIHVGIGAFLGMWTFGLIMIVPYLAFLSPNWLRSIFQTCLSLSGRRNTDSE